MQKEKMLLDRESLLEVRTDRAEARIKQKEEERMDVEAGTRNSFCFFLL